MICFAYLLDSLTGVCMQSAAESYMSRSPYVAFKLPGLFLAGTIASLESPKPLKTMIVLKAKINLVIYCRRRQLRFIYKCWCMQAERRGASNLWLLNDLRLRACRKHFSGTSSVKVSSVFSTWACLKQIFFFFSRCWQPNTTTTGINQAKAAERM